MEKIIRVDTLDTCTLEIELSGGSIILLNVTPLLDDDPAFAALRSPERFMRPATDGDGIVWQDGPRLSLDRVFSLLHTDRGNKNED